MPPISPKSWDLPFESKQFTWATFEDFFCAFLASQPKLLGPDDQEIRVKKTRLYGRKGDKQNGIDIKAEMANGETWVFQCKHYPKSKWTPGKTREAIKACIYEADRKFLLITRTISEKCYDIIDEHPEWEIWDSRKISREFLNRVDPIKGAGILYRHFGPGWPEQFFEVPGRGPLIGAEARYFKLLKENRIFHHRTKLIGREEDLKKLNAFVKSKQKEVLLLKGRAGIGKSRLLLEFSRKFNRRHKDATLWFVSDDASDPSGYAKSIEASPKPLVLVFDDAHRLGEIRRALFPVIAKRDDIKIILSLRPGPTNQVRAELIESGYGSAQIEEGQRLKELSAEESMKLAETVLGKQLTPKTRQLFAQIARESPLLAVMGAELWRSGNLENQDLRDTNDFRDHILRAGFERDIKGIEERFGTEATRTFAKLLALLAPVRFDSDFFEPVASFVGHEIRKDQVSELAEAFDDAGLLYKTEAGFRIVPDLLSDQLAFEACYDRAGRDRNFAVEVIGHFDPEKFPRIIQHAAEAEWQAASRLGSEDSVVAPIWMWFRDRFESSSFYDRKKQLSQWGNIAHLQPVRTIQLAEEAIRLTDAPCPADSNLLWTRRFDNHSYLLEGIPSLLKPLANSNPDYTASCLDILWKLGKDRTPQAISATNKDHPIVVIGEIAGYEIWKSIRISEAVLDWIDSRFRSKEAMPSGNHPAWILAELLSPFFKTAMEESWSSGRTISWRTHLVSIPNTAHLRDRALSICRMIAQWQSIPHTLGVVDVVERAVRRIHYKYLGDVPLRFRSAWDVERRKAMALLVELIENSTEPVVHFRARKFLLRNLQLRGDDAFNAECRSVCDQIPDSFELRMIRATLSYGHHEFDRPSNSERSRDWRANVERQWEKFVGSVAEELRETVGSATAVVAWLDEFVENLRRHNYTPNFRYLFPSYSQLSPSFAIEIAEEIIRNRNDILGESIDSLISSATEADLDRRFELCRSALDTKADGLICGAIGCLAWWRRKANDLPAEAWSLLFDIAPDCSPSVIHAILNFVWMSGNTPNLSDWRLLASLPPLNESWLGEKLVEKMEYLLEQSDPRPDGEVVKKILSKLNDVPSVEGVQFENFLSILAKEYPAQVFLFFWKRLQIRKQKESGFFDALPLEFESIEFPGILNDSNAASVIEELESRILNGPSLDHDEYQLLQNALVCGDSNADRHLMILLEKSSTLDQLHDITNLIKASNDRVVVLTNPDLTRGVLNKAQSLGESVYDEISNCLKYLPGGRGFNNAEPDSQWKALLETTEKFAHKFADDPTLGPFYASVAQFERDWMEDTRRDSIRRMEDHEFD